MWVESAKFFHRFVSWQFLPWESQIGRGNVHFLLLLLFLILIIILCVYIYVCVHASLFSQVLLCSTPWTVACQVPLSMRKEYWSGGHFLLHIPSLNHCAVYLKLTQHCKPTMKLKAWVAQLGPTLCDPMDWGSSVHGILQAGILE